MVYSLLWMVTLPAPPVSTSNGARKVLEQGLSPREVQRTFFSLGLDACLLTITGMILLERMCYIFFLKQRNTTCRMPSRYRRQPTSRLIILKYYLRLIMYIIRYFVDYTLSILSLLCLRYMIISELIIIFFVTLLPRIRNYLSH